MTVYLTSGSVEASGVSGKLQRIVTAGSDGATAISPRTERIRR